MTAFTLLTRYRREDSAEWCEAPARVVQANSGLQALDLGLYSARFENGLTAYDEVEVKLLDSRDPDPTRNGIFRDHNCARCQNGVDLARCPTPDRPGNCGEPHARND